MRERYNEQLEALNTALIEMGDRCREAAAQAAQALSTGDVALAELTRHRGPEIDRQQREIEQLCMGLLLHQQPVARDLRLISAALKMITDMERIGDQAEDICEIAAFLEGRTPEPTSEVCHMAKAAIKMVGDSIQAFHRRDVELAQAVILYDDIVDDAFRKIKETIISMIAQEETCGEAALDLLMAAKYLERIADHATNIAESVIYAVTGIREENE